jgi:hypothetical protein
LGCAPTPRHRLRCSPACPYVVVRGRGPRAPSASRFAWEAPDTSMTRSADDETLRVPAGCLKHPVCRPCLRRAPRAGPDVGTSKPRGERRRAFDRNLPLVHLLASARPVPSGLRFPGTTRQRATQLRCHATATPCRSALSASKRSAGRHLAFSDPRTVAFAPAGRSVGPFRNWNRGSRAVHDVFLPEERRAVWSLLSS